MRRRVTLALLVALALHLLTVAGSLAAPTVTATIPLRHSPRAPVK